MTALLSSSQEGYTEIVTELIKSGADVNAKDNYGWTPIMRAALNGHKEIIYILINSNADVNAKSNEGFTALMGAAASGEKDIVEILLKNGVDVNAKSNEGFTALMVAETVVSFLIKSGADVNAKDNDEMYAIAKELKDIADILISYTDFEEWSFARYKMIAERNIGKFICIKNATVGSIYRADSISLYDDSYSSIDASVDNSNSDLVDKIIELYERNQNDRKDGHADFYGYIEKGEYYGIHLHILRIDESK